jgi:hypothetical protein
MLIYIKFLFQIIRDAFKVTNAKKSPLIFLIYHQIIFIRINDNRSLAIRKYPKASYPLPFQWFHLISEVIV